MLVKLNGGPAHRKVMHIPDNYRSYTVVVKPRKNFWEGLMADIDDPRQIVGVEGCTTIARYAMMVIQNPLNRDHTIPCVTPKGEVIFQYVKEK